MRPAASPPSTPPSSPPSASPRAIPPSPTSPRRRCPTFLDNQFAALFADPAWGTDWSTAVEPESDAADFAEREGPDLGQRQRHQPCASLPWPTRWSPISARPVSTRMPAMSSSPRRPASSAAPSAISRRCRAASATSRSGSTKRSDRMKQNRDLLATQLNALEGVDPAEAKVRFDTFSARDRDVLLADHQAPAPQHPQLRLRPRREHRNVQVLLRRNPRRRRPTKRAPANRRRSIAPSS